MSSIQFKLNRSLSADSTLFEGTTVTKDHSGDLVTILLDSVVSLGRLDSVTVFYHGIPGLSSISSF